MIKSINIRKTMLAAALITTASFANAGTVTLPNGITFEPLTGYDSSVGEGNFDMSFNFVQWWEKSNGDVVSISEIGTVPAESYNLNGYGELTDINDVGNGIFNCNGCEMTFEFGGIGLDLSSTVDIANPAFFPAYLAAATIDPSLTLAAYIATPGSVAQTLTVPDPAFDLSTATMSIWVDYTPDLDSIGSIVSADTVLANESNAANGTEWLTLEFKQVDLNLADAADGVLGLSEADTFFGLTATGGTAYDGFNKADDLSYAQIGLTDLVDLIGFGLTGKFEDLGASYAVFSDKGTGAAAGIAVPEPTSVAIFGLGLLGLAGAARRKQS
jgi:hypothetical protein